MFRKLPRWVEYGAFSLALLAGFVNAIGFLGFRHEAVSHLSGSATQLGVSLIELDGSTIHLLLVLLSFVIGASISGFLIEGTALKMGRHYSSALTLEAILLLMAMIALNRGSPLGHHLASAACGLQNALVTTYSGATIRTTHVTGIVTDLGLMIGARLRGRSFDRRKALLFLLIVSGFISGGLFGAVGYRHWQFHALAAPALLALALAGAYRVYLRQYREQDRE